jgi:hypothetical protein
LLTYRFALNVKINGANQLVEGDGRCKDDAVFGRIKAAYRRGNRVVIEPGCMRPVQDEILGQWNGSSAEFFNDSIHRLLGPRSRFRVRPGSIVLLVESPHKHEFDNVTGTPLRPLNNPRTRQSVRDRLKNVIKDASAILNISLRDSDIVIVNPVQFQASLANFMNCGERGRQIRLQEWVRDPVWRGLFGNSEIRSYFDSRIRLYHPGLILVAPTAKVREPLQQALRDSSFARQCVDVTPHPSGWGGLQPPCVCFSRRPYGGGEPE